MTKEDKDALLQEMLETSAFGVLLERVSAYVVNLRVVAFSDAREDRERIRASDAVNVVRRMFEQFDQAPDMAALVRRARDAGEANRIVTALVRARGADEVVKVKSMATEEIGLNEHLEAGADHVGIQVLDGWPEDKLLQVLSELAGRLLG